jgi:TolA-binding protein
MPTLSSADPVLETQVFWERYKKTVFAVLVLAILAVAAWAAFRIYSDRRETTAANMLTSAKTAADFQKVIAQFPSTPAGASAHLFLAEEQRKEKKFAEANTTLQSFIDKYPKHELKGSARLAMAANLESLGKRDEALAAYQKLAADDPEGFSAPMAMISQVYILKEKKQPEEARRICETILTKYRESLIASEATRQLRFLKAGEPSKPVADTTSAATPAPAGSAPATATPAPPAAVPAAPPAAAPPTADKATATPKKQ